MKYLLFIFLFACINSFSQEIEQETEGKWGINLGINSIFRGVGIPNFHKIGYYGIDLGAGYKVNQKLLIFSGFKNGILAKSNTQHSNGFYLGVGKIFKNENCNFILPIRMIVLRQTDIVTVEYETAYNYGFSFDPKIVALPKKKIHPYLGFGYYAGYFTKSRSLESRFNSSLSELVSLGLILDI